MSVCSLLFSSFLEVSLLLRVRCFTYFFFIFPGTLDSDQSDPYQDSGSEYVPSEEGGVNEAIETSSEETQEEETKEFKPKKRIRREQNWRRAVNKKKRCAGEEYITKSGKTVPSKPFQPFVCVCKNKCHLLLPEERQRELHTSFYGLQSFNLQTSYLFSLVKVVNKLRKYTENQNSQRDKTRIYYIPDATGEEKKVCKSFFQAVFQVSSGRLDRLLKTKPIGAPSPCDKRGKHPPANKTNEAQKNKVRDFIKQFPSYESHYCRPKSNHRRYLAPDLSIGKMYNLYKNESNNSVSYFVFREIFNKEFNLHFHPPISDSCKKCDLFNIKIKSTVDEVIKRQLEIERELHQRKAQSARDSLQQDAQLSKEGDITVICFDLMKTLPTPVLTTGICYYKRQLWTYCFSIHNMATNDSYMFVWNESVASRGPQEVGSCILYYIKNFVATKKLVMYSDQCGGQNRNIKMSVLCNYIVSSTEFEVEEIDHKFLLSGHSYLPCDQDFGLIEKEKKFHPNIFIPDDWNKVITNARKKNPFKLVEMKSSNFFSTKPLENNITNRKISKDNVKVEWLKIQWLRFQSHCPFDIQFKYSNNNDVPFETVDISKRKSLLPESKLPLLYPNGNVINDAKKKDLLQLKEFIPPMYYAFYENLRSTAQGTGGELLHGPEEDED